MTKNTVNRKLKQGVKWEDTSKKEENEDIFPEKEDKRRTFFSKINTKEAKKVHVNYSIFFITGLHMSLGLAKLQSTAKIAISFLLSSIHREIKIKL